jgi:hypothetical protein
MLISAACSRIQRKAARLSRPRLRSTGVLRQTDRDTLFSFQCVPERGTPHRVWNRRRSAVSVDILHVIVDPKTAAGEREKKRLGRTASGAYDRLMRPAQGIRGLSGVGIVIRAGPSKRTAVSMIIGSPTPVRYQSSTARTNA